MAAGLGLAAPLVLPAAQLTGGSIRGTGHLAAFPAYQTLHLVFQTFDGSSLTPLVTFRTTVGLRSSAAYIGIIAVVLGVLAVVKRRRQPAIVGAGGDGSGGRCHGLSVAVRLLSERPSRSGGDPLGGAIQVLVFAVAVLSGAGLDIVVRSKGERPVRRWLGAGIRLAALLLLLLWLFGRGHLPPLETHIRAEELHLACH